MDFIIKALPAEKFEHLFQLGDQALEEHCAKRLVVQDMTSPCRVSMKDANLGENILLINFTHLEGKTPYRASHAIFVRQNVQTAQFLPNQIPKVLTSRFISLRIFDADNMMIDANVADGGDLSHAIPKSLSVLGAQYIHLHYAKAGCYAARVDPI